MNSFTEFLFQIYCTGFLRLNCKRIQEQNHDSRSYHPLQWAGYMRYDLAPSASDQYKHIEGH